MNERRVIAGATGLGYTVVLPARAFLLGRVFQSRARAVGAAQPTTAAS